MPVTRARPKSNESSESSASNETTHRGGNVSSVSNRGQGPLRSSGPAVELRSGNSATDDLDVQPKLRVNEPDDKHEKEAERVADAVMRMADPGTTGDAQQEVPLEHIQRMCPRCQRRYRQGKPLNCEECEADLQRSTEGGVASESRGGVEQMAVVASEPGQPVSDGVQSFFERRMGEDFSGVRIHTGHKADRAARSINARAFTLGKDVAFRSGEYKPGTQEGKRLLAHELTHVVQQASGVARGNVQRKCYSDEIQPVPGCTPTGGDVTDVGTESTALFHFPQNCDDFRGGEAERLRAFAKGVPENGSVSIHGFASEEGPDDFNEQLSCLRAHRASSVMLRAGLGPGQITDLHKHGATPGAVGARRSVVVDVQQPTTTPQPEPVSDTPRRSPPTITAGPPREEPEGERECFGIGCESLERLREAPVTPSEKDVHEAIELEKQLLRRTKFEDEYKRVLPKAMLYGNPKSWGPEMQKKVSNLERKVERRARKRIFTFLKEQDPTFTLPGMTVDDMVNSDYAR